MFMKEKKRETNHRKHKQVITPYLKPSVWFQITVITF